MSQVKITNVNGRHQTTFADGSFFGKGLYPSQAGAKIAIARAGHSYESEPKAEKVAKGKSVKSKSGTDWEALIVASGHAREDFWAAFHIGKASVKGTYTSKKSLPEGYSEELCVQVYNWAKSVQGTFVKSESSEAVDRSQLEKPFAKLEKKSTAQERVEATVQKVAERMETIVGGSHPNWIVTANAMAVECGFSSYRALKNAHKKSEGQDRSNLLSLRDICIRAANAAVQKAA
jgi:hypothetical protein